MRSVGHGRRRSGSLRPLVGRAAPLGGHVAADPDRRRPQPRPQSLSPASPSPLDAAGLRPDPVRGRAVSPGREDQAGIRSDDSDCRRVERRSRGTRGASRSRLPAAARPSPGVARTSCVRSRAISRARTPCPRPPMARDRTVAIVDAFDDPNAESDLACIGATSVFPRARLPTAASARSTRRAARRTPPRPRRATTGSWRSASTSTWSRRSARTATSCSSRPTRIRTTASSSLRTRRRRSARPRSATAGAATRSR